MAHYQDLPGGSESALVALKSEPELKERNELVSREPGLNENALESPAFEVSAVKRDRDDSGPSGVAEIAMGAAAMVEEETRFVKRRMRSVGVQTGRRGIVLNVYGNSLDTRRTGSIGISSPCFTRLSR